MDDTASPVKVCPYCAKTIKAVAVKCRYCQSDLTETVSNPAISVAAARGTVESNPPRDEELSSQEWRADEPGAPVPFLASRRLLGILVVLCLVFAGLSGIAWYRSENRAVGDAPSAVITSSQARDAGLRAAATLTRKVLSYDGKTLDADMKSAESVMGPTFRTEYAKAMAKVRTQTVKDQVKLTASVVATSIVSATDQKVVALIFVNQLTSSKGTANHRLNTSRVRVTLGRSGGDWRVITLEQI